MSSVAPSLASALMPNTSALLSALRCSAGPRRRRQRLQPHSYSAYCTVGLTTMTSVGTMPCTAAHVLLQQAHSLLRDMHEAVVQS